MLQEQILWHTLVDAPARQPHLAETLQADVCVIGAGYTGLSAAVHLAEAGRRVVLLESSHIGAGGSGRNVGLVNAGTWARPDDLNKYLGEAVGEKLTAALGAAPKLVFDTIDRLGIDAQDTRTGNLHMGHNAAGEADVDERFAQLSRRGADVQVLSGAECHEYCGTTSINKALLDKRAGTINPYAYVLGLAAAAMRLGVQLFEDSAVNGIEKQGSGWLVKTAAGSVACDKVVIATNAYTEGEWTELRCNFFPGYYYQVASAPLTDDAAKQILPGGQGSWDTRQVLSSIRRDADGRLLLGSLGNGNQKPAWFLKAWADRVQQHYFPYLKPVQWEFTWTGCIAFTPDHLMRLFEPAPGLVAVTGYNGRGVTTGSVVGKAFADYLCHQDPQALPIPFAPMQPLAAVGLRSCLYEAGFSLYHAGQCLRIVI